MATAVAVVWGIGLLGALAATLVILKLSLLVIRALIDIARLGVVTEQAAHGIAANVAVIPTLPDLGPVGDALTAAASRIAEELTALAQRVTNR
jgi:hypothetical protein